jgi:hypothetical protein
MFVCRLSAAYAFVWLFHQVRRVELHLLRLLKSVAPPIDVEAFCAVRFGIA